MWITADPLTDWSCVAEWSVGGLEWIGFSKKHFHKLLCISSQKCTLIDCITGTSEACDCEYDEAACTAICSLLPGEVIHLSGQYGGEIPRSTWRADRVRTELSEEKQTLVYLISHSQVETLIFKNYGFYTCGFSYDGAYFVFAQDAGITLLRRK